MFSPTVTLKVGGKEVSRSGFGASLKEAAIEALKERLKSKIEGIRCPIHDQNAKAVLEEGPELKYRIHGCCDVLTEEVKKYFGAQG
jgi:hypothetical protein